MKTNELLSKSKFHLPIDISIPLRFNGEQTNVYGVDPATSKPCEYGDFVGDTRLGGSVNFEQYTLIPHCNSTHTECVGHITDERLSVAECLNDVFMEALLISVEPENATQSGESYPYELDLRDEFITKSSLETAISNSVKTHRPTFKEDKGNTPKGATLNPGNSPNNPRPSIHDPRPPALIIRTVPNDDSKLTRKYDKPVPPFFSNDAMDYIVDCGFKHLLVDLPSIDRLYDDGKLSNHRIYWNVGPVSRTVKTDSRKESTITELVFVRNEIEDGKYLLNLQIAPFVTDAVPSRPLLFPFEEEKGRPF